MAMGKNKTGIMAAISAAAASGDTSQERAERTLPKGTIGSVRAGIGGIQEIDTAKILPWGPSDRLELTAVNSGDEDPSVADLAASIAESGQQVPALLRPAPDKDGYFEVIYGRRRILACRSLGLPVKALVRVLGDSEALRAKGLENGARVDLSYYERARFAEAILEQGYTRADAQDALAVSKATLSQLERVTRLVPRALGDAIGAAPGAGRPKWMALGTALEGGAINEADALEAIHTLGEEASSDDRLQTALNVKRRSKPKATPQARTPLPGTTISRGANTLTVTIKRDRAGFMDWADRHLDALLDESFQRFQEENRRR